jgi:hypothetical protein
VCYARPASHARACACVCGSQPYDVVLSALLDVVREDDLTATKATTLQAAWRRRNVQGKFQTAVQEMMEINGLIEDIERREEELKVKQDASAAQIERAMQQDMMDEPPPKMPSEKDMKNPAKMQEYMLQVHAAARHATPRHATPRHATPRHATPPRAASRSGHVPWRRAPVRAPQRRTRSSASAPHDTAHATAARWARALPDRLGTRPRGLAPRTPH